MTPEIALDALSRLAGAVAVPFETLLDYEAFAARNPDEAAYFFDTFALLGGHGHVFDWDELRAFKLLWARRQGYSFTVTRHPWATTVAVLGPAGESLTRLLGGKDASDTELVMLRAEAVQAIGDKLYLHAYGQFIGVVSHLREECLHPDRPQARSGKRRA